jgi:hypothetical protein
LWLPITAGHWRLHAPDFGSASVQIAFSLQPARNGR